mmetsp:Transcript_2594/g.5830  ORF Transcript_2594/g.5830 Transcript_2594/m.5830 type:complete len:313 (+) Transcript_2594:211-1149(+)
MSLKEVQGLFNELSEVQPLSLGVINSVAEIEVLVFEDAEHRQYLAVVRHQCLADHVPAQDQELHNLHRGCDDLGIARVERRLDGDDELGNDGKDLGAPFLEHVVHTLHRQEAVRLLLFADAVKEDGEVVVVVELVNVHLPSDLAAHRPVEDLDRQVATVVKAPELRTGHWAQGSGTSSGRSRRVASWVGAEASKCSVHGTALVLAGAWEARRGGALCHRLGFHQTPSTRRKVRGEVAEATVLAKSDHAVVLQPLVGLRAVLVHHVLKGIIEDQCTSETKTFRRHCKWMSKTCPQTRRLAYAPSATAKKWLRT